MTTRLNHSTVKLTILLGILAAFGPLSIDTYLSGLPAIGREFRVDDAAAQLTLSMFFVGLALGQAVYGPIADRLGRRGPLLVGCALYAAAAVGCALAPSINALIAMRFVQAIGGCAGMVISRSVVRDLFDAHESARMYSFLMLVMGVAPILAPLLGGQLLVLFGWRAIFWMLTGFGLLCFLMVAVGLPETLPPERRAVAGIGQVLRVYGGLLRDRHFIGYTLVGGLISAGMFAYISGSPFVFIDLYGVAPQNYGWIFGTNAFGIIAASQINRWLLARFRAETILRTALMVIMVSGVVLTVLAATGVGGLGGLLAPLFVCIAGYGFISPNATALAMAAYGRTAGSASALLGTLQFALGAAAGALVGVLANGTALPMAAVIAGCELVALATFFVLVGRRTVQISPAHSEA
ncbi:MAG TPA: Bcr/CflA family multidrug efflux MFS transporter [Roseiflexaceae bacterium]|nr:Bcr/CflA family multidrug efflux MFS transporter [Roseiflexaceae bacterium]